MTLIPSSYSRGHKWRGAGRGRSAPPTALASERGVRAGEGAQCSCPLDPRFHRLPPTTPCPLPSLYHTPGMLTEAGWRRVTPPAGARKVRSPLGSVPGRNTHAHDSSPVLPGVAPPSALAYFDEATIVKSGRKQELGLGYAAPACGREKGGTEPPGGTCAPPSPA